MIRLGSCGALREDMKIGDLIIADNALCGDGVTPYYVGKDFIPAADKSLSDQLAQLAEGPLTRLHRGKVWSTDAILRETREVVQKAVDGGAIAVDMVSSTFLTIAQLYKIPAAVILVGIWLHLPPRDWAVLALTIGVVLAVEVGNTAIEALVDLASPDTHPLAKVAKDAAAGAVLILALAAVVVGLTILGPPLWARLMGSP